MTHKEPNKKAMLLDRLVMYCLSKTELNMPIKIVINKKNPSLLVPGNRSTKLQWCFLLLVISRIKISSIVSSGVNI